MNQKYFRMQLEDPALPIGCTKTKSYFGSIRDLYKAIRQMEAAGTHSGCVRAFGEYLTGKLDASHMVCGYRIPLLEPLSLLAKERMTIMDHEWNYEDIYGVARHLRADRMIVEQVILRDTSTYYRCIRPHCVGLQMMNETNHEWRPVVLTNDNLCMLLLNAETISMIPYVLEEATSNAADALGAMWREETLIFSDACGEWFGRG